MNYRILNGDVVEMLKTLEENSVDAIVTDPPYGLEFMGKDWDAPWKTDRRQNFDGTIDEHVDTPYGRSKVRNGNGASYGADARIMQEFQKWCERWAIEAFRVLKPGGHILSFGGSRTYHRMACAIEDAGFEIRDQIQWIYGCLDEETQLVSRDGIKPYHKAMIGEHVLCYSPESGEYSYQPILEIVEYDYSDTAYRLIGDFGEQVVSRHHRCIVERGGDEVFELAENIAREFETCVPILENLSELQHAIHDGQSHSSVTKQILQPDMLQCADRAEEQRWETPITKEDDGNNLPLRKQEMGSQLLAKTREDSNVQSQMQWNHPRGGVESARSQRAHSLDSGIETSGGDSHDGGDKPGVEGRTDISEAQGSVCGSVDQIRSLSSGIYKYGAEGRLRDGASSIGCADNWQSSSEGGSSTSPEPSGDGEPNFESNVVRDERRTQSIRAWRGHKTAVVRVVPFHYVGKVWCLRVPTGAFVAVRGGVAFPTGNSGFPKSMNVSLMIDKAARGFPQGTADPESPNHGEYKGGCSEENPAGRGFGAGPGQFMNGRKIIGEHPNPAGNKPGGNSLNMSVVGMPEKVYLTEPFTDDAKQWDGWGTALKPAHEPIVLARKPLIGTVVENVLTHGTGALNIAACRIPGEPVPINKLEKWSGFGEEIAPEYTATMSDVGRWPANLIHDGSEEVLEEFAKYGDRPSCMSPSKADSAGTIFGGSRTQGNLPMDSGTAARFFYCAKASKEDRNEGCWHLEPKSAGESTDREDGSAGLNSPRAGAGRTSGSFNHHPTVKPTDLMRYLCKMITPPKGTVLDCFMGSGSTGKAALLEGFNFIGIDQDADYCTIATARMEHVLETDMPLFRGME